MTNLRDALSAQWGRVATPPPIVKRVLFDLLALLGLGLALAVTFALTGLLSGFAGSVLAFLGLAQRAGAEASLTPNIAPLRRPSDRLQIDEHALRSAAKVAVLSAVGSRCSIRPTALP
jgi:membrane protein